MNYTKLKKEFDEKIEQAKEIITELKYRVVMQDLGIEVLNG